MGKKQAASEEFRYALSQKNLALIIGNGVNLSDDPKNAISWQELVLTLAKRRKLRLTQAVVDKLSFAEIGDILRSADETPNKLPKDVVTAIKRLGQNKTIVGVFAQEHNVPVLTTNFDIRLAVAHNGHPQPKRHIISRRWAQKVLIPNGWNVFRGPKSDNLYARNIPGLWHMHGSIDLVSSIKLTSAQYASAFGKASQLIKKGLYANTSCDIETCFGCVECGWAGQSTWLDIFFHRNLVIMGFGFSQSETFLRPLLTERFKYLKHRYGSSSAIPASYFVVSEEDNFDEGQRFFFESFGFKILTLEHRREAFWPESFKILGGVEP
jgi:hypothetical protein